MKTIAIAGTFDTKGNEYAYVKELIESLGFGTFTIHTGVFEPIFEPDVSNKEIIMLAIATSIDALAVGISFAFLNVNIVPAASLICIITFLVCLIGVFVGNKVGDIFLGYAELVGGVILILIGFSIFNEHTQILSKIFNLF